MDVLVNKRSRHLKPVGEALAEQSADIKEILEAVKR
jgi:hypothetical protein